MIHFYPFGPTKTLKVDLLVQLDFVKRGQQIADYQLECCGHSSLLCFPPPGLPLPLSVSPHTWPSSTIMLTWSSSPINPLHKPLDSLLSAPDRTTHYRDNYTCLALVLLATSLSYSSLSCCFWTTSNFCSSACSYPDHSLQLAHLALSPAPSSTTCYPPCSINPFLSLFIPSTSSLSSLGFSIVYHNTMSRTQCL